MVSPKTLAIVPDIVWSRTQRPHIALHTTPTPSFCELYTMASQTTICPSALPIIARRGAPAAVKVSAKTLGQRLGWKKISRGHEATRMFL